MKAKGSRMLISAFGVKRTRDVRFGHKADIARISPNVRFWE
jgi:hypothetical protein